MVTNKLLRASPYHGVRVRIIAFSPAFPVHSFDCLWFNEHIQCMKKKVSKMLGLFSRIRPLLTVDSANRIYKVMVLPVLDYCDIVFHECGQGNQDKLELLQRRVS